MSKSARVVARLKFTRPEICVVTDDDRRHRCREAGVESVQPIPESLP